VPTARPTDPPTRAPTAAPTPAIAEDCLGFDDRKAAVKEVGGRWKIVVDSVWLMDFGSSQAEATAALNIIKYYRMNEQCFVGRPAPSLEYFLVNRNAPTGSVPGEDCLSLKPGAVQLEVKQLNGRWKIVAGNNWIFDFADNESEARLALAIINTYRFEYVCYVGRPDTSMTYLRR
jgi:hypothetical protein